MARYSILHHLVVFLLSAIVVLGQNTTNPYWTNLTDCVNYWYPVLQQDLCTYLHRCDADLCSNANQYYYDELVDACEYITDQTGDLQQTIKNKCNAKKQAKKVATVAGGVVGGLAGIAAVGAIGAIGCHMFVHAIPIVGKLGIAGAKAGGAAAAGGSSGSHGASAVGQASAVGHASATGHGASAGASHGMTSTGHAVSVNGGAHAIGHSSASAGHAFGHPASGSGPAMTGDGGASHAIGQGAQAPMATDGGGTAHTAISGGSGQGVGPYNGQGYAPTGQGYAPTGGQGYAPTGGQSYAPTGQGFSPNAGQGIGPYSGSSPIGQGAAPFAPNSAGAGQGVYGPYNPAPFANPAPYAPGGGFGQSLALTSPPVTSTPPFLPGSPAVIPVQPRSVRSKFSLLNSGKSTRPDEEQAPQSSFPSYPDIVHLPSPASSFPEPSVNTPSTHSGGVYSPAWPQQPLLSVDTPPAQPQAAPMLNNSVQYTSQPPRAPYERLASHDSRTE